MLSASNPPALSAKIKNQKNKKKQKKQKTRKTKTIITHYQCNEGPSEALDH
jgi:hypothetical protein